MARRDMGLRAQFVARGLDAVRIFAAPLPCRVRSPFSASSSKDTSRKSTTCANVGHRVGKLRHSGTPHWSTSWAIMTALEMLPGDAACGAEETASRHAQDLKSARNEGKDLVAIVRGMATQRPAAQEEGAALALAIEQCVAAEADPARLEMHCDQFARKVRAYWLRAVAAETAWVLRSPTERETHWLSAEHDSFGYERDLQPVDLEAQFSRFFDPPPAPWSADHVLFSSGQSALVAIVLSLASPRPLRIQHIGGYFETREFITSCPSLSICVDHAPDVVIAEPVECNGSFVHHDDEEIVAAAVGAKNLVLDTTLMGPNDNLVRLLERLDPRLLVVRFASGLKLFQGGLELANVGVASIHAASTYRLAEIAARIRHMRTLCGSGLRHADVLALEAPHVFDRAYAERHAELIFANNTALAAAVARSNVIFTPPFSAQSAPYCVFNLRDSSDAAYRRLADRIDREAAQRNLLFQRGGSFGFRGHRYEIVRPDGGQPFLRVAMGRQAGWSCRGIIEMMAEIASSSA